MILRKAASQMTMQTFVITTAMVAASCAHAQKPDEAANFPSRPIRVVIGFTPGGQPDISARLIGPKLSEVFGQQVVVDNRPGAGGVLGARIVASANPDGHTLLSISSAHVVAPAVHARLGYDPLKDFSGISQTTSAAYLLVVPPSLEAKTLKEFIALAKAKPGQINFSSGSTGSGTHFAAEMLKVASGIDVVHIPYKGVPEALTDTVSGRVQFFMSPLASAINLVRDGKLRALGVSSAKRVRAYADVPTIAEAGLAGFEWDSWGGLLTSSKTPRAIVNKLNREVSRALNLSDVQQRLTSLGAEPMPGTPEQFDKLVAAQLTITANLARKAGIKAE
jgi:tripartite-type tricarboxylate transporter receptor subunit TctC